MNGGKSECVNERVSEPGCKTEQYRTGETWEECKEVVQDLIEL